MRTAPARLLIFMLSLWCFLMFMSLAGTGAQAADPSGTWSSRVPGKGYTQTYQAPGGTRTDNADVKLELTMSGSQASGTVTTTRNGRTQKFSADGTSSGSTFRLHVRWGWDGATNCDGYYTLAVTDSSMKGSGSFVNVGVTVSGTFDLVKGGGGPDAAGIVLSVSLVFVLMFAGIVSSMPAPTFIGATNVMALGSTYSPPPILPAQIHPAPITPGPINPTPVAPAAMAPATITPASAPAEPHVRPADAPMQQVAGLYPANYPGPKGTWGSMECPFCHMVTLSPMSDGWFCTNTLCPGRARTSSETISRPWYRP